MDGTVGEGGRISIIELRGGGKTERGADKRWGRTYLERSKTSLHFIYRIEIEERKNEGLQNISGENC